VLALERGTSRTSYIGAAIPGLPVGRLARAFAQRFGLRDHAPQIVSADAIAAELGDWARGRAMDQQLSGEKAGVNWAGSRCISILREKLPRSRRTTISRVTGFA
jgi:hypothetical protein